MTRVPVYSTWYSFTQDVDAEVMLAESRLATDLGCAAVFLDDGWQRFGHGRGYQGCGDWLPDELKFADLPATVKQIQGMGAAVGLWIAPLLLGRQSEGVRELGAFAPHWDPLLSCQVLDPRHPEVRSHVEETCLRLVTDYGVDLLKIDFLDRAMTYQNSDSRGDLADIGQAMAQMLQRVRRRLADAGRDAVAFEFRQPYVSPAIASYGEVLRAGDCPGDSVVNRISTLNARMLSVGQVVHTDPMMWGTTGGAEAVAQQVYGGWFAMRLAELNQVQTSALRGLLALWRSHVDVTLDGVLEVHGGERGYDLVRSVRTDLNRSVIARYSPSLVDLDISPTRQTTVINATSDDRVVMRTTRPITAAVIRSAAADEIATVKWVGPGLVEMAVPPYGSATLHRPES
jgi:alpha-galactosidase